MPNLICDVCGAPGDIRCYTKCPLYKPLLKWKRPPRPGVQATHCGVYFVETDPYGGHFGRWHAHRKDIDEQLTHDGFATRDDAKWFCEKDADQQERETREAARNGSGIQSENETV